METTEIRAQDRKNRFWTSDVAVLVYIALATIVLHWFTGKRYGLHRDQLATLEDARHLAWGRNFGRDFATSDRSEARVSEGYLR